MDIQLLLTYFCIHFGKSKEIEKQRIIYISNFLKKTILEFKIKVTKIKIDPHA